MDEALNVLLTTNFFVGLVAGWFLDAIIPGQLLPSSVLKLE